MNFTVAIIGRPNVGKSTLFNRLVGKRLAIVNDSPGVTRDRREGDGRLADLRFTVIDTAGLEDAFDDSMEGRMRAQTNHAVAMADVALLLIDGRSGLTPLDSHFARWLRTHETPTILLANKCEGRKGDDGLFEAFKLGLGDPIALSAEHGIGIDDLYDALVPFAEAARAREESQTFETVDIDDDISEEDDDDAPPTHLQMAVVGRPNVGKSTLVNKLIGEDRMLTGPEAGITRDAITVSWTFRDRPIRLIDTAGLRRKAKVNEQLEYLSVNDSMRSIRYAHCVVLLIDATAPLEKQDLTIARTVIEEGRSLVIAVNKWDLAADRRGIMRAIEDRLQTSLPQVRGIPVVTLSAKTGVGVDKLLPAVFKIFDTWNTRISTANLNRWLTEVCERHPPPLARGRRLRLRYMTQAKARPPTFIVFANIPEDLPESYNRYLINGLREAFDLPGVPVRIRTRRGKNPYAKD
ncbi:MAG: ribosome biogenesis GTPase Der [Rhodospirillales bacterium]|jgi:GTPase|nr:ribosome biogenesis GTPase Der [Rhodospirillales bacterium]